MAVVLGVTGGIGTGKSTVLEMLSRFGAGIVSADLIAHEIIRPGMPAFAEIVERFGESIIGEDGEIDRRALGEIVFSDSRARKDLENITHPRIMQRVEEIIERFRANPQPQSVLAVEIPLLYECGLEKTVDKVLLVAAEQQTQVNRLTSRSVMSKEQAIRRIQAQMPISEKLKRADYVIWNDGDLKSLELKLRSIWAEILLL